MSSRLHERFERRFSLAQLFPPRPLPSDPPPLDASGGKGPGQWPLLATSVRMFDLADPEQVPEYQAVLQQFVDGDAVRGHAERHQTTIEGQHHVFVYLEWYTKITPTGRPNWHGFFDVAHEEHYGNLFFNLASFGPVPLRCRLRNPPLLTEHEIEQLPLDRIAQVAQFNLENDEHMANYTKLLHRSFNGWYVCNHLERHFDTTTGHMTVYAEWWQQYRHYITS